MIKTEEKLADVLEKHIFYHTYSCDRMATKEVQLYEIKTYLLFYYKVRNMNLELSRKSEII